MTRMNTRRLMAAGPARIFRLVGGRLKTNGPAVAPPSPPEAAPVPPPSDEQVRVTAYHKWCEAGCPAGDGVAFWLAAERELRNPAS